MHLKIPLRRRAKRLRAILLADNAMLFLSKLRVAAIEERERGLALHAVRRVAAPVALGGMGVRRFAAAAADADEPEGCGDDAEGDGEPVECELGCAEGEGDVVGFKRGVEGADQGGEERGRRRGAENREQRGDGAHDPGEAGAPAGAGGEDADYDGARCGPEGDGVGDEHPFADFGVEGDAVFEVGGEQRFEGCAVQPPFGERVEVEFCLSWGAEGRHGGIVVAGAVVPHVYFVVVGDDVVLHSGFEGGEETGVDAGVVEDGVRVCDVVFEGCGVCLVDMSVRSSMRMMLGSNVP